MAAPAAHFDLNDFITHHIGDSYEWHIPLFNPIPLPGFLTVHTLMMMLAFTIVMMLFLVFYRKNDRVPTGLTNALEAIIQYVRNEIVIPNVGEKDGTVLLPMFLSLGFFILVCNLMGLIPCFSAATGNVWVTGSLAYLVLVLMVFGTLARHGLKGIWDGLVHPAMPKWMIPIMLPLEFLSVFVVRCGALCLRLFANMVAGHILITSFLGLCVMFGVWASLVAFPLTVGFYCLEVGVAFLQAYIFILLASIFIGLMYHPKH
jgi:F-type H+-transporting ATPase subunit a